MQIRVLVLVALVLLPAGAAPVTAADCVPSLGAVVSFERVDETQVMCTLEISDLDTGDVILSPALVSQAGREVTVTTRLELNGREVEVRAGCTADDREAAYHLDISDEGGRILSEKATMRIGALVGEAAGSETG